MLQTQRQVVRHDDMGYICCSIGTHDTHRTGEDNQHGHNGQHAEYLGQYQIAGGVDSHDVEGVNLLGDAHGAYLRGYVRPHLACQDETHNRAGKLKQHDFTRRIARHPTWHPRRLDVQLHLNTNHRSDEERNEQHDTNGVDTQLRHLLYILLPKHAETLWY